MEKKLESSLRVAIFTEYHRLLAKAKSQNT
mgnify:FL=1